MAIPVTLIPGDGIGPEVSEAVVRILDASGAVVRVGTGSGAWSDATEITEEDRGHRVTRLFPYSRRQTLHFCTSRTATLAFLCELILNQNLRVLRSPL